MPSERRVLLGDLRLFRPMLKLTVALDPTCLDWFSSSEYTSAWRYTGHSFPRLSSTDGIFCFGRMVPLFQSVSSMSFIDISTRPRYALPSMYPAFMRFASLLIFVNHLSSISRGPP